MCDRGSPARPPKVQPFFDPSPPKQQRRLLHMAAEAVSALPSTCAFALCVSIRFGRGPASAGPFVSPPPAWHSFRARFGERAAGRRGRDKGGVEAWLGLAGRAFMWSNSMADASGARRLRGLGPGAVRGMGGRGTAALIRNGECSTAGASSTKQKARHLKAGGPEKQQHLARGSLPFGSTQPQAGSGGRALPRGAAPLAFWRGGDLWGGVGRVRGLAQRAERGAS
jgi:hypothetical protein